MFTPFNLAFTLYVYFFHFVDLFSNDREEEEEWEMVQKKGNQFTANDKPFYVNGFNTYWLMAFAGDESTRGKVSEVLKQASSVGMTVCRTWAFNDGQWRALQKSPSLYDERVFQVYPDCLLNCLCEYFYYINHLLRYVCELFSF